MKIKDYKENIVKKLKNILEDKFIFLDIDGVLSLQKQWKTRLKDLRSPFNEDCSKLLDNFLTENPNIICFGKLKNRVIKIETEIGLTEDSIKQLKEKIK